MGKRKYLFLGLCTESWTEPAELRRLFVQAHGIVSMHKVWKWIYSLSDEELIEVGNAHDRRDQFALRLTDQGYIFLRKLRAQRQISKTDTSDLGQ